MSALIITSDVQDAIRNLFRHATDNGRTFDVLKKFMSEPFDPKIMNKDFTIYIPENYVVTYTHEEQPFGWCRHFSMSVSKPGRVPNEAAVQMMCQEFGFVNSLDNCKIWTEPFGDNQVAINVLEPLDGQWPVTVH